jgi:hypothetical protein
MISPEPSLIMKTRKFRYEIPAEPKRRPKEAGKGSGYGKFPILRGFWSKRVPQCRKEVDMNRKISYLLSISDSENIYGGWSHGQSL